MTHTLIVTVSVYLLIYLPSSWNALILFELDKSFHNRVENKACYCIDHFFKGIRKAATSENKRSVSASLCLFVSER